MSTTLCGFWVEEPSFRPRVNVRVFMWRRKRPMKVIHPIHVCFVWYKDICNTHKIFLKFLHLLLVALQTAVVHASALNRYLSNLQVHLLELETSIKFSVNNQTTSQYHFDTKQLNCLASLLSTGGSTEASIQAPGKSSHVRRCSFIKTSGAVELWQLRHVSVSHVSKPACTKGPRWFTLSNQHDMMGQFTCDTHPLLSAPAMAPSFQ